MFSCRCPCNSISVLKIFSIFSMCWLTSVRPPFLKFLFSLSTHMILKDRLTYTWEKMKLKGNKKIDLAISDWNLNAWKCYFLVSGFRFVMHTYLAIRSLCLMYIIVKDDTEKKQIKISKLSKLVWPSPGATHNKLMFTMFSRTCSAFDERRNWATGGVAFGSIAPFICVDFDSNHQLWIQSQAKAWICNCDKSSILVTWRIKWWVFIT